MVRGGYVGGGYDELKIKKLSKELSVDERIKWFDWKKSSLRRFRSRSNCITPDIKI